MDAARSHELITKADLRRLARIAQEQREDFFSRHPEFAILYRKRLLCAALADDAALHYLNGMTGLAEFSVWSFYAEHAEAPFPFHLVDHADFGQSKFARAADAPQGYAGRRVSLHGRSIEATPEQDPLEALQRYLRAAASPSARELGQKAVVLIAPEPLLGAQPGPRSLCRRRLMMPQGAPCSSAISVASLINVRRRGALCFVVGDHERRLARGGRFEAQYAQAPPASASPPPADP
jgi:hypothetical protein